VDVTAGLEDGLLLINSSASADELALSLGMSPDHIVAVDASAIGRRLLGRNLPNVPMLGVLVGTLPYASLPVVEGAVKSVLSLSLRPAVVDLNLQALRESYEAVSQRMVASHG
jgi:Pyruvate/2-oxoacid:ferredoxin oxidoreductase gamma subunit